MVQVDDGNTFYIACKLDREKHHRFNASCIHHTLEEADNEAARLAKKERAQFIVFKATRLWMVEEPPVMHVDLKEALKK